MIAGVLAGLVLTGLDVVERDGPGSIAKARVGLVAHAASRSADGRHAIDVLRARGVTLVRVFAPEHGLRGQAAAGAPIADSQDASSGLPVVSLYGATKRPRPEDLRDLDALVVDLQDAGVRFYTYASTLLLCLDAAADAGLSLVVLDRPNPQGGENVEGPASERPAALLSMAPGPLLHGLTLGELARLANARRARPARLEVVAMRGWRRGMTWRDTGLAFAPPSPNLRSAEAALAYPAVALLEATNLSEGRGTATPFLLFGAPWLDSRALLAGWRPAGFSLEPADFTPEPGPAAPEPKHAGRHCRGVRVGVSDPGAVRPWAFGLDLLYRARRTPGFAWLRGGEALDALVGTRRVREALERGETPQRLIEADALAVAAFRRERAAFLLYP